MIKYDTGRMGLLFILRCSGSVFPRAILMALPDAILAALLHTYTKQPQDTGNLMNMSGVDWLWVGYTSVLSFLLVFRNNQAYQRFWEGTTAITHVRAEWFNAISSLIAFSNHDDRLREQVDEFQQTLIRLASLLFCSALQQICDIDNDCFEIIETEGIKSESLEHMYDSADRCEVLMQWIQRLIVDAHEKDVVKIPAPILTRAYQELAQGFVDLKGARKICEIPFPFPYAQMITCMLIVHWVTTPIIASQVIDSKPVAAVVCFFVTFVLWCLVQIALEIDQPFGEDPNDLPLHDMQRGFNRSLLSLMHPLVQVPPSYTPRTTCTVADEDPEPGAIALRVEATAQRASHWIPWHAEHEGSEPEPMVQSRSLRERASSDNGPMDDIDPDLLRSSKSAKHSEKSSNHVRHAGSVQSVRSTESPLNGRFYQESPSRKAPVKSSSGEYNGINGCLRGKSDAPGKSAKFLLPSYGVVSPRGSQSATPVDNASSYNLDNDSVVSEGSVRDIAVTYGMVVHGMEELTDGREGERPESPRVSRTSPSPRDARPVEQVGRRRVNAV